MITQKVQIAGVEYEVSAATYKMLQDSIEQLHISVKNYNALVSKDGLADPVVQALAPKPVPSRKKK